MADRINYGETEDILEIPDLVDIQRRSFASFLQKDVAPKERKMEGLQQVLHEAFPVESHDETVLLSFESYDLGQTQISPDEALCKGKTYSAPLYAHLRLENRKTEAIEAERVFLGDMPLMTETGTFVIEGAEHVVVSQFHRSPGIFFDNFLHSSGRQLLCYRVIPNRGGWIDVQYGVDGLLYVFPDRRRRSRRFLVSTLLRALGRETNRELLSLFYDIKKMTVNALKQLHPAAAESIYLVEPVMTRDGTPLWDDDLCEIGQELEPISQRLLTAMASAGIRSVDVVDARGAEAFVKCLKADPTSSRDEALCEIHKRLRPKERATATDGMRVLEELIQDPGHFDLGAVGRYKINTTFGFDLENDGSALTYVDVVAATARLMKRHSTRDPIDDACHLGNRRVRTVGELLENVFRTGLERTARLIREKMTLSDAEGHLTPETLVNPKAIVGVIRDSFKNCKLSQKLEQTNPLSALSNTRRLSALDPSGLYREHASLTSREVHASHYGRVCPIETSVGPNVGLTNSLALYGRVNELGFIETPYRKVEGGWVTSKIEYLNADEEENHVIALSNALLDRHGMLCEATVTCRFNGNTEKRAPGDVDFMDVSPKQVISAEVGLIPFLEHNDAYRATMAAKMQCQALPLVQPKSPYVGTGLEAKVARDSGAAVMARHAGIVAYVDSTVILITPDGKLTATSPSTKESLALLGNGESPTVNVTFAPERILYRNANQELTETFDYPEDCTVYSLRKFNGSNDGTCINQRPTVRMGQTVDAGDVIADCMSSENGELALGRHVRVAFMPWSGHNFGDGIVISERLSREDVYTSIHIEELFVKAAKTKVGPEEITRDIPNVGEEALRNLDPRGIVRVGTEVKQGDILVGKLTPKSETEMDSEERLLRAIFGEKASDVKDSSLTVPIGLQGIVVEATPEFKVDRKAAQMTKVEIRRMILETKKKCEAEIGELREGLCDKLSAVLLGSKQTFSILSDNDDNPEVIIPANTEIEKPSLNILAENIHSYSMPPCEIRDKVDEIRKEFDGRVGDSRTRRDETILILEMDGGVQKTVESVRIRIAKKRKIEVGDEMADRHGNKSAVSRIVPEEDMPYLSDGTPVDVILNPFSMPCRMNVGLLLEAHLGHAAKVLDLKIATPALDGISEDLIRERLQEAKKKQVEQHAGWRVDERGQTIDGTGRVRHDFFVERDGKVALFDGRTGEKFQQRVVVGELYMMKLADLAADKIHARSTGPYSLVTQQPQGGKRQNGGQRFGEMEVWALEAYGAAFTLQELLTVKSDDITGRTRIYESIVRGDCSLETDVPESLNLLINEIKGLCLDIRPLGPTRSESPPG